MAALKGNRPVRFLPGLDADRYQEPALCILRAAHSSALRQNYDRASGTWPTSATICETKEAGSGITKANRRTSTMCFQVNLATHRAT